MCPRVILTILTLISIAPFSQSKEKISSSHLKFFETRIRPLFVNHCIRCHGPKRQRADLRLDSLEAMLKGGTNGPALVRNHPEKSLLIKAVSYVDKDLQMPPKEKLSALQIKDLTAWIKIGAPYPQSQQATKATNKHWSFQPIVNPALPDVQDRAWTQTPIDYFILSRLSQKGLQPAPQAKPLILLRRLHFAVLGLPPSPHDVRRFEQAAKDDLQKALDNEITRLLASPKYGERWGRHWLDVARYADSNGLDENIAHGNAWRYRDYVIEAFNKDKPFNQFLVEQLAGDLLPKTNDIATDNERLIATGFLSLGPKVLAEVDETKMEMDIVDEQIDTLSRAFLGLTMGCARCHDHKFDPIETEDYYALAGIFRSTRTMESFKKIAKWHENPLRDEQYQAQKRAFDAKLAKVQQSIKATQATLTKTPKTEQASIKAKLNKLNSELERIKQMKPVEPTAMGVQEGTVVNTHLHRRGSHLNLGPIIPRHVPEFLQGEIPVSFTKKTSGRMQLAQWMVHRDHPLTARVIVNRIWRWHFGKGLVNTPDNFGQLGERPTHPQLLDWLATWFVDNGWSIKKLHRLILLSNTWQQSIHGEGTNIDPENRLYWRYDLHRLEAEAIRDAMLRISGRLDTQRGGSLLHVGNREFLFNHTSKDLTKYNSRRSTIYLPVIRNHLFDMLQLFDCTDATVLNGHRATTTVAPQALFLMNSELMIEVSDSLALDLLQKFKQAKPRITELYMRVYGRQTTTAETSRVLNFIQKMAATFPKDAEPTQKAWSSLCQTLLASNEFIYLR